MCAWTQVEPLPSWFADTDVDGFGDPTATVTACSAPTGYVANGADCNDSTAAVDDCAGAFCSAGSCVQCLVDDDCGNSTDCQQWSCDGGACLASFSPDGTPVTEQSAGDCQLAVCDGKGGVTSLVDDGDVPDDGLQCTLDMCVAGNPTFSVSPAGAPCTEGGGVVCDGAGTCVECVNDLDCPFGVCLESTCVPGPPPLDADPSHAPNSTGRAAPSSSLATSRGSSIQAKSRTKG